jgi:hypothetical protein
VQPAEAGGKRMPIRLNTRKWLCCSRLPRRKGS